MEASGHRHPAIEKLNLRQIRARMLVTAAQMRELDRISIEEKGLPGLMLMELAGRAVAEEVLELEPDGPVAVFCGLGNNGGDGYVVARVLDGEGVPVRVYSLGDTKRLKGDAKVNFERLAALGVDVEKIDEENWPCIRESLAACAVAVDAMLGTGLQRSVGGLYAEAIDALNALDLYRVAVDMPSGIHADTGEVLGTAFQADITVTFGLAKLGLAMHPGLDYAGQVVVADISLDATSLRQAPVDTFLLTEEEVRSLAPPRPSYSHKGTYGHLLVLGGSPGKSGAAALACLGAHRAGTGLVTCACDAATATVVTASRAETMTTVFSGEEIGQDELSQALEARTAVLCGPGWGQSPKREEALLDLLSLAEAPLVLDADALNLLAGLGPHCLGKRHESGAMTVLTPHPGEAARLLKTTPDRIQANRLESARNLAQGYGCHVVLKGARSIVAGPEGCCWINPTGNPALAAGGSGDVLAGIIGGLLARRLDPLRSLLAGVYVHGYAADRIAEHRGTTGVLAGEVADEVAKVLGKWTPGSEWADD